MIYDKGHRKIAVVQSDEDYGKGLNTVFTPAFGGMSGAQVVMQKIIADDKAPDFTNDVKDVLAQTPDAVVFLSQSTSGGKFMQDWFNLKGSLSLPVFVADGFYGSDVAANDCGGAQVVKGIYGSAPASDTESARYKIFQKAWADQFAGADSTTDAYTAHWYDIVMIVALAMEKAGKTDSKSIHDALRDVSNPPGEVVGPGEYAKAVQLIRAGTDINYEGASGPCDFDANGDVPAAKIEIWYFDDTGTPRHDSYIQ